MRRSTMWVGLALAMGACAPPSASGDDDTDAGAEEDLSDLSVLSRRLYREWDAEDAELRAAGMAALDLYLSGVDVGSDKLDDRAWALADLEAQDVATIARPDRPLDACFGLGMAYASKWPAVDHARLQIEADQTPTEPTATFYDRTVTNLDDPSCFVDRTCEVIDTTNDMERATALYTVQSTLLKNFRWVGYTDAGGTARDAFYSRSWYDQSWPGDKGKTMVWQSYSIDVWIDRGDGTAWRYQTLWNETDVGFAVTEALMLQTVQSGTEKTFEAGDDAIGALFHAEETP